MKRAPTREEKAYMGRVAALGCIACRNTGREASPAIVHHIRTGQGHMRASHKDVLPLCPRHHQGYGIGVSLHDGIDTWQRIYGPELVFVGAGKAGIGHRRYTWDGVDDMSNMNDKLDGPDTREEWELLDDDYRIIPAQAVVGAWVLAIVFGCVAVWAITVLVRT